MGKYDYNDNENEKFNTFYRKNLQRSLQKYNLSLECMRDFVLMMKMREPLIQLQELFKQLNTRQKYGLLNIFIDTGTDGLFEINWQWYPPYGTALEVAKQYGCRKEILQFLISENPLNHSYCKGAAAGLFAKIGMTIDPGKHVGNFINRTDAASVSCATKAAADSAKKEEELTAIEYKI